MREINIWIESGIHRRGERYPEHDFSLLEKLGVANKGGAIACSNEDIKTQIDAWYQKNYIEDARYFYYTIKEDK
jgi:hypothetical protein